MQVEYFSPVLNLAYTLQQHMQLFKAVIDEIVHNGILCRTYLYTQNNQHFVNGVLVVL